MYVGVKMKISIRIDDVTPDMDWSKFLRFKELCDKYQVKPLVGVVPRNRDKSLQIDNKRPDFWAFIRKLDSDDWVIAQHGAYHVYTTKKMGCFPLNRLSEFAGLPYKKQYERISYGKCKLEKHGIYTDIFVAPAHSYDITTLNVLEDLGFAKISDGFGNMPYKAHNMTFYPISYRQKSVVKKKNGYTTLVVHTNTLSDKDFARYERLFEKNKENLISYYELFNVGSEKRGILGKIKEYIMALTKYILVGIRKKI
jgi:predicted deacetylase